MDIRFARRTLSAAAVALLAVVAGVSGCHKAGPQVAQTEVPAVPTAHPVEREVTDFVEFIGRTDAVHSVNVVPRVTGYLTKMPFKEGSEVSEGELLFEIDPRPYQAQLDQATSQVDLYEAQLKLAQSTLARYEKLESGMAGSVTKQEMEQYRAAVAEAEARVTAAKKSLEVYRLNKEFTQVKSRINGQISRYYLTLGNLVNQDQTLLTTVVSLDPMYAYFDMDERTLIQVRKAIYEGRITPYGLTGSIPVWMELQGETDFPHKGVINFINNQVNAGTGTISMRGLFANPKLGKSPQVSAAGAVAVAAAPNLGALLAMTPLFPTRTTTGTGRLMSPGMYVRIRLPIGQPHKALLVIDRAIQSDQGLKYVYVIGADGKAEYRRVTTGALQPDGLRVVEGVRPDDQVLVGALQMIRAKMDVKPEPRPMPRIVSAADETENKPGDKATAK
jgi:multidrug efflux system membrane fusion protein